MSGSFHAAKFVKLPTALTTDPTNPPNGNPWRNVLQGTTLASGTTSSQFSGVVDASACLVCNITTPADLLGVASIKIFHSEEPDGTFTVLKQLNSAADYSITLTASSTIPIDTGLTAGLGYIKLQPNATVTGGDLVLKVGTKAAA